MSRVSHTRADASRLRIWVISELYYPEDTSTGYFLTEIAEGLARHHDVRVVCGQPTYSMRGTRAPGSEHRGGVDIRRVHGTTLNKDVAAFRILNMLTLAAAVFWHVLRHFRAGDIALVVTTPPLVPPLVLAACRLRGVRSGLIVHDVYPEALVAAGWLRRTSAAARLLDALFVRIYRAADRVSVLGRDMQALLVAKLGQHRAPHVVLIPNWWEPELHASSNEGQAFLETLGLAGKFIVQHAGNLGPVHGAEALIIAAKRLALDAPNVHFLFIGGGGRTAWLKNQLEAGGLENFTVVTSRPRAEQRAFLSGANLAVMSFRPGMLGVGVPSRAYNIMAVNCPIVAAMDCEAEVARVISEEQLGWVVPPGDGDALALAIIEAQNSAQLLHDMGNRARAAAERRFTRETAITAYLLFVRELALV